ncbi:alpha/beta hydrolase family protein [Streptomyces sp. NBC_01429]|uniref:alpha/beta hydrolase family protein n=1 Tax=Streptomyces sp. NBC_01429 TaxID=2903862 RepID=UPI002E2DA4A3|nr:alpha/beta hydrolase [Streptomyces sp. NBC_01429]
MGQQAVPGPGGHTAGRDGEAHARHEEPGARLGRAVLPLAEGAAVAGVVLVLPTGEPVSTRGPSRLAALRMLPLARSLARAGAAEGLLVHPVRYGTRGWNGADASLAADAEWAAREVVRRYGDVPVCLAGHGMGGRAALRAAGHQAVNSVLAMAPWLPESERERGGDREPEAAGEPGGAGSASGSGGTGGGTSQEPEPVRQLVGRQVLIVHGTDDARTDPELSYRLAERAKKANRDTCRFEVHSDGHALRQHHAEVLALASDFVLGALLSRAYSRPVADALAAPPPLGLRMPLAAGFGRSLRH